MASSWTNETLDAARREGDPAIDKLVEEVLQHRPGTAGIGRIEYNHILDLADALVASPELALVDDSLLSGQLRLFAARSAEIAKFLDPIEAPDWVDEKKLALATELWDRDGILALAVLYAASLPACYLMKKGVPALYDTTKLADHKYVFQRIYETGFMLEGVMKTGGLKISRDVDPNPDDRMADLLNRLDPGGCWLWQGRRLRRGAGEGTLQIDVEQARRECEAASGAAKRYIWGPGYVAAKKVRFLHASMRCMLLNPDAMRRAPEAPPEDPPQSVSESISRRTAPWDLALGLPINQEDLAFVLLTFGYLIPRGMAIWGREVSVEQKEAFLHLWRLVGHVIGIREDLMTDQLDEATALYEQILKRNGGTSEPSVILTNAVMGFVRAYLPSRFGIGEFLPALLIVDQLGSDWAKLILPSASYDATRRPFARLTHGVLGTGIRTYFWLRQHVIAYIPILGVGIGNLTDLCAQTLIGSWRDSFRREPFYIPSQATSWVRHKGVTPEYEASLMRWRQRLFDTITLGLGSIIVSGLALSSALAFYLLRMRDPRRIATWIAVATAFAAAGFLKTLLPRIAAKRPVIDDTSA